MRALALLALAVAAGAAGCIPRVAFTCGSADDCPAPSACIDGICRDLGVRSPDADVDGTEGEGEGDGSQPLPLVVELDPQSPVAQHSNAILRWSSPSADACTLDGAAVAVEGTHPFVAVRDTTFTVRCTRAADGADVAKDVVVDVVLPADISATWPEALAGLRYRVDVVVTGTRARVAAPADIALSLTSLLAASGVEGAAHPDSLVAVAGGTVLPLYHDADDALVFLPLPALSAPSFAARLSLYFDDSAPAAGPSWSEAPYDDGYDGAAGPVLLGVNQDGDAATLAIAGFAVSPEDTTHDALYDRSARLVVDGVGEHTTPIASLAVPQAWPAPSAGPTLRYADAGGAFTIIETRVDGPAGVDVRELIALGEGPFLIVTSIVANDAAAAGAVGVRFASLVDLDVPEVGGDNRFSNLSTIDAQSGVPVICEPSELLCVAYAHDGSAEARAGDREPVDADYLADDFTFGSTEEGFIEDKRAALAWEQPALAPGARLVVRHALAANEALVQGSAAGDAVRIGSGLVQPLSTSFSPVFVRD